MQLNDKDIEIIEQEVDDEKEYGHLLCDFDDYNHDLRIMADLLGYDVWWDDDDERHIEEEEYVKLALDYYYDLHN